MENKYGIKEKTYLEILKIFQDTIEVKKVILFGSRARGDYKQTSDIDLAITFENEEKKLQVIRNLDDLNCALKFDVLNIEKIENEKLLENIQTDGIVIYEK